MKQYKFIQKLLLAVLALGCVSCSQDEETQVNQQNLVVLNVTDTGLVSSESQTRTADEGFVTTFTQGDQLGLFAVKDGVIMDEINNMQLTYNGSSWSGKPILYDERLEGVVFYAYYPYQADMTGKTDLQGEDDFFAPLVDSWNLTNAQSDQKEYAKQDLMTSGKTELIGENGNYSLSFQLSHRMSLVVVKLPSTHYLFTDAEGTVLPEEIPYIAKPNPASISFEIGKEKILPYYDAAKDEYRLLRKPSSAETITGYYNGKKCLLVTEGKMEQGKYKRFVVDGGHQEKKHHLQVGDFYYADGNIVSVTDENPPVKGCIGVVYYVGNPQPSVLYNKMENPTDGYTADQDVLLREHANCTHGLVISLNTAKNTFGPKNEMRIWFVKNFVGASKYIDLSGNFYDTSTGKTTSTTVKERDRILGYNNTRIIELYSESQTEEFMALEVLKEHRNSVLAPNISSDWYLPSAQELVLLQNKENVLTKLIAPQIKKVYEESQMSIADTYWSSTERNASNMYYMKYSAEKASPQTGGVKSNTFEYRFTLVF